MAWFLDPYQVMTMASMPSSSTTSILLLLASMSSIATIVISLCTTHKHSKMSKQIPQEEKKLLTNLSSIKNKARVVAKMISWKKTEDEEEVRVRADDDDDEALWKKTIIMGEKCRPWRISGQIMYDSEGNRLPERAKVVVEDGCV